MAHQKAESKDDDIRNDFKHSDSRDDKGTDMKPLSSTAAEEKIPQPDHVVSAKETHGFVINSMNMKDAYTGKLYWESDSTREMVDGTTSAYIPKDILQARAVSREINFSSAMAMSEFKLQVATHTLFFLFFSPNTKQSDVLLTP